MEETNNLQRILGSADKVEFRPFDFTTLGKSLDNDPNPTENPLYPHIKFAEPDEINTFLTNFNLRHSDLMDSGLENKLQTIYYEWKIISNKSLADFLSEMGSKLGGRFSRGLLDRVYEYVMLSREERDAKERLYNLKEEKKSLKKHA